MDTNLETKTIPFDVNYIARNEDGKLYGYQLKPTKGDHSWLPHEDEPADGLFECPNVSVLKLLSWKQEKPLSLDKLHENMTEKKRLVFRVKNSELFETLIMLYEYKDYLFQDGSKVSVKYNNESIPDLFENDVMVYQYPESKVIAFESYQDFELFNSIDEKFSVIENKKDLFRNKLSILQEPTSENINNEPFDGEYRKVYMVTDHDHLANLMVKLKKEGFQSRRYRDLTTLDIDSWRELVYCGKDKSNVCHSSLESHIAQYGSLRDVRIYDPNDTDPDENPVLYPEEQIIPEETMLETEQIPTELLQEFRAIEQSYLIRTDSLFRELMGRLEYIDGFKWNSGTLPTQYTYPFNDNSGCVITLRQNSAGDKRITVDTLSSHRATKGDLNDLLIYRHAMELPSFNQGPVTRTVEESVAGPEDGSNWQIVGPNDLEHFLFVPNRDAVIFTVPRIQDFDTLMMCLERYNNTQSYPNLKKLSWHNGKEPTFYLKDSMHEKDIKVDAWDMWNDYKDKTIVHIDCDNDITYGNTDSINYIMDESDNHTEIYHFHALNTNDETAAEMTVEVCGTEEEVGMEQLQERHPERPEPLRPEPFIFRQATLPVFNMNSSRDATITMHETGIPTENIRQQSPWPQEAILSKVFSVPPSRLPTGIADNFTYPHSNGFIQQLFNKEELSQFLITKNNGSVVIRLINKRDYDSLIAFVLGLREANSFVSDGLIRRIFVDRAFVTDNTYFELNFDDKTLSFLGNYDSNQGLIDFKYKRFSENPEQWVDICSFEISDELSMPF